MDSATARDLDALRSRAAILDRLSHCVVVVSQRNGHVLYANRAFAQLLERRPGDLLGEPFTSTLLPRPGSPDVRWREILRTLRKVGRWDGELVHPHGLGERWSHATITREVLPHWGPVWLGMLRDVTQDRLAAAHLRAHERQLRAITENNLDGIFFVDRSQRVEYLNPAAMTWLRNALKRPALHLRDVQGHATATVLGGGPSTERELALNEQAMSSGQPLTSEQVEGGAEHQRTYLALRIPIRDPAEQVVGLLIIARDITSRTREERARLRDVEAQRETLVREVHHRIKNHLQGLLGLMRLQMNRHTKLVQPFSELIAQVRAIAGIYGLAGLDTGMGAELVRIVELVVQAHAGCAPMVVEAGTGRPTLSHERDAVPVALVINELVANATKHRGPGARDVCVRMYRRQHALHVDVRNAPARLPPGFDLARGRGVGNGLRLLSVLLPSRGACLRIEQHGDEVLAQLVLSDGLLQFD